MKRLIGFLIFSAFMVYSSAAQECGPFCPVCSGTGSSTSGIISPGILVSNLLMIPGSDEESGILNLRTGLTSWMDAGIGYAAKSKKTIWSVRLQVLSEDESNLKPTIIVGAGSVQTGGSDQSLFLQLSKSWEPNESLSIRLSTGIASLMPDLNKYYGLGGITLTITEAWSPFIYYDGINFHPGISWIPTDWLIISSMLVESKQFAFAVGLRLDLSGTRKQSQQ